MVFVIKAESARAIRAAKAKKSERGSVIKLNFDRDKGYKREMNAEEKKVVMENIKGSDIKP